MANETCVVVEAVGAKNSKWGLSTNKTFVGVGFITLLLGAVAFGISSV